MQRLRQILARDPVFCATFAVLWVAALQPIWRPQFLPCPELPGALAAIARWHRYADPAWGYQAYYQPHLPPLPGWGYFLPVHLLAHLLPIPAANKVFLSLYALALPVGAALLLRQMGRSPYLALFAWPFVLNASFGLGDPSACAGLAVLLFALWALDRFLEAPARGRAVALGLLALALYFCHLGPWLCFLLAAPVLLASHGRRPRRIAAAIALILPSLLVASYAHAFDALRAPAGREPLLATLERVPSSLLATWPGNRAFQLILLLAVAWMALVLTARAGADDHEARAGGSPHRLELCAGVVALGVLLLPAPVNGRLVAVAALLALFLPHGPIVGRRKLWLAPVALVAFAYPLFLADSWRGFDRREGAPVRRLLGLVPRGASTLTLVYGDDHAPSKGSAEALAGFHAYPQLYAGGFDPWALDGFPTAQQPGAALPAPDREHPERFDPTEMAPRYDYILTFHESADGSIFGPSDAVLYPLLGHEGEWRLYRARRP